LPTNYLALCIWYWERFLPLALFLVAASGRAQHNNTPKAAQGTPAAAQRPAHIHFIDVVK